jgi:2-amino-4-hydroxy-6-hydroxymethyldihydropteridine diphosphokinase
MIINASLPTWIDAFIGLGSNLNRPVQQIQSALQALQMLSQCRFIRHSSLYLTPPLGQPNQPSYVNAVAWLQTQLSPMELLMQLQIIEHNQGRVRSTVRWDARTLDLDLLLYGEWHINEPQLSIPHPHLHRRAFVLIPLHEIVNENFYIPHIGYLRDLLQMCDCTGIERLI